MYINLCNPFHDVDRKVRICASAQILSWASFADVHDRSSRVQELASLYAVGYVARYTAEGAVVAARPRSSPGSYARLYEKHGTESGYSAEPFSTDLHTAQESISIPSITFELSLLVYVPNLCL